MAKIPKPKIGLVNKHAISVSIEVAAVALDPDEYSYRAVFREIMPKLYVMRQRGMSFTQLHRVLNQAGFPIALATVRTYYNESLLEMLDECQKYLKRMERMIDGAEKAVEVDRTSEMHSTKQALRSAVSEEGNRLAASSIAAFASVGRTATAQSVHVLTAPLQPNADVRAQTPTEPLEPADSESESGSEGTSSRGFAPPDPLMGSEALKRPLKPSPALVAPDAAANAAPSRVKPAASSSPSRPATATTGSAYCLTVPTDQQIEVVAGVPPEVLGNDVLEHPAIAGLMLTRQQRLYVGRLEYRSAAGVDSVEKGTEMMNRREWKQGVPVSVGRTSSDFVELDTSIIGRRPKNL